MKFRIKPKEISVVFSPAKNEDKNKIVSLISKNQILAIVAALTAISISAWAWFYSQGLTLSYNDARSHLNIARRVVESLQPGFAQLGSVWLPLFHILELPLIGSDFFWHSGIAGSIISMVAYVFGGVFLALLARELKFDKWATIIAVAVYAINPNLVFMQTTPMTESLLLSLSLGAVYYMVKWTKAFNIKYLIFSGLLTMLATLTRYDAWFLFLFMCLAVYVIGIKKKNRHFAQGNFILFSSLAGLGIVLWFVWNLLIFGDPLYFVLGQFSAGAQQKIVAAQGRLFSKGDIMYSIFLYLLAVKANIGIWLSLVSIAGGWLFIRYKQIPGRVRLTVGLLTVPIIFNVLSLILGQSVIHLPDIAPYTWFNDRYGLMVLPAVAIAVGFLANKRKAAVVLVLIVLFLQTFIMYSTNQIITIQDGVRGASGDFLDDVGQWVTSNVDDGLILVAASSNDGLLFIAQKPMSQFISEGAQKYWKTSLKNPTKYAKWIVMQRGDLVYKGLKDNKLFLKNYTLVYRGTFAYIYKLNPHPNKLLTKEELP